jgi:fumarylacetoacetase
MIDHTHDPTRRSWVASANGHAEFPLTNLPFGVFSPPGCTPRGGIAIGDDILDLAVAVEAGLLTSAAAEIAAMAPLNAFMALGAPARQAVRHAAFELLAEDAPMAARQRAVAAIHRSADCTLHLPAAIGDYTDFYAGLTHATTVGKLMRPDNPLMPNYKYVPIGYHGRASSVSCCSDGPVHRPNGQRRPADAPTPEFGPCRNLDYELEFGIWIGTGNALGTSIPIGAAHAHIAGFCLLNDWSARDIQAWEYQPLGPFLAKSFHTTISPWIVTPEALAPFRVPQAARPPGDPAPLPHLLSDYDQLHGALDIAVEASILTPQMRRQSMSPHRLSRTNTRHLYWTFAQMVAHHASGGCNLRPGDLFGSGTISSPEEGGWGSLQEITFAGRRPIDLPSGETRRFLEDGDEIIFRAHAVRSGFAQIGFGECRGTIAPAP